MKTDSHLKFDMQGKPRPYYGNTIISFVNDETMTIYEQAFQIQGKLKTASFADCLAFLPPSSFHVTVLTLCREIDRDTKYWPEWIERTASFRQIDKQLEDRVKKIPVPEGVWMEMEECELTKIILKPCTQEDDNKLRRYRDMVSAAVAIRHPGHENFRFHISLDYQVKELDPVQEAEKKGILEKLTHELREQTKPFLLTVPQFVIFNDMMSYEREVSKRGDLY
jgi:hypothetical protein